MLDALLDVQPARVSSAHLVLLVTIFIQLTEIQNAYKSASILAKHVQEMCALLVSLNIFSKMVSATLI